MKPIKVKIHSFPPGPHSWNNFQTFKEILCNTEKGGRKYYTMHIHVRSSLGHLSCSPPPAAIPSASLSEVGDWVTQAGTLACCHLWLFVGLLSGLCVQSGLWVSDCRKRPGWDAPVPVSAIPFMNCMTLGEITEPLWFLTFLAVRMMQLD